MKCKAPDKPRKKIQARLATPFWVELASKDVLLFDERSELSEVVGSPKEGIIITRPANERMGKVEERVLSLPWGLKLMPGFTPKAHLVPSDVRNLHCRILSLQLDNVPFEDAKAFMAAKLLASLEQDLHPHANPKVGHAFTDRPDEPFLKPFVPQKIHERPKRSHARKDDPLSALDLTWGLRNKIRGSDALKSVH
jgi:hypothetical protein